MFYCLGTTKECVGLDGKIPQRVYDEVLRGIAVLDAEYGPTRDYFSTGGCSVIANTRKDLFCARQFFDYTKSRCEWATRLGDSGYCSALYLLSNEYSVMLYIPIALANNDILENIED